jgi:predicted TIM-barrel fold metal-dependent hydrolase
MLPVEEQIAALSAAGVGHAILFPTVVHPEQARDRREFRSEMDRLNRILRGEVNPLQARIDSMKELVSALEAHGGMFTGFGSVPAGQDMDATGRWIEDHIAGNGLRGIGEIALGAGQASGAENIFRISADHGGRYPLWIHTFNPLTLEDIRTLASYAEKYPSVKVIFGHGGGSFWLETMEIIREIPNVWFDISASFSVMPLRFAVKEFPERVLFSSDMPYGDPCLSIQMVERTVKDEAVRELVLGANIRALLG